MTTEKGFENIDFARIKHLLDFSLPEELREITYVANCTTFRRLLLNTYGQDDLDIDHEIATNPDIKLTYLGYKRFLESDLKYIYPQGKGRTANGYKRDCKYLAKQMLIRGYAFARAVQNAFPKHLRLSIHESVAGNKVSMRLLDTRTGYTTPWHCSVAQLANGEWVSAPMSDFEKDERLELVYEQGRPSYYREVLPAADALGITQATASYLQPATLINAQGYLSGESSPYTASPAVDGANDTPSVFSLRGSVAGSASSSPEAEFEHKTARDQSNIALEVKEAPESSVPYGRRLIPQIMDELAAVDPDRTVFTLTSLSGAPLQLREVSALTFTTAVDALAWWLHEQLGRPDSVECVGYIGPRKLPNHL